MNLRKMLPVVAMAFILPILLNFASVEAKNAGKGNPPGQVKKMGQPQHDNDRYSSGGKQGGPPPWAPAHGYRAKHRYSYYPHSQVYHDDSRGLYFYYRNGEWGFGVDLPDGIVISGDAVSLEMDVDRPYTWHDQVRDYYPGP